MDLAGFSAAMAARGCVGEGKNFCGTFGGYPFTATFMNGTAAGNTAFSLRILFGQRVPAALYKTAKQRLKGMAAFQRMQNNNAFLFFGVVRVKGGQPADAAFDALIAAVTAAAAQSGLTMPGVCPICKQGGCDHFAYHGVAFVPVHGACVQNRAATQQMKVQKNELEGSYALGTLGAVLGGLVGCIPTLLLYVFANMISGWLCALIPLGAYGGYRLLKGKMTRAALPIIIVVSALMAPVFNYLAVAFLLLKEYGFFGSVSDYFTLFRLQPDLMWRDLGMCLLFTGLGILIVSGIISRNNKHAWNEASFSAGTLRPISGHAPAPAAQPFQEPVMMPGASPVVMPHVGAEPPSPLSDGPAPRTPGELE